MNPTRLVLKNILRKIREYFDTTYKFRQKQFTFTPVNNITSSIKLFSFHDENFTLSGPLILSRSITGTAKVVFFLLKRQTVVILLKRKN